ncbi:hypothetical protein EV702DRAFT_1075244 [Suillus placidus]|uniref:Uncharacterized protein n=1 Tax=Suillus placidus TaxID=48579 RepID=A0A9P7A4G5_9AGAM|nr:hypothetical protein EV702DRAFT_1075244 [Suillus placidus]
MACQLRGKKGDEVTCEYTVRDLWMLSSLLFLFDTLAVIRISACWRMVIHFVRNGQGWMGMDAEQDVKWRGQTGGAILIYEQLGISVVFVCEKNCLHARLTLTSL